MRRVAGPIAAVCLLGACTGGARPSPARTPLTTPLPAVAVTPFEEQSFVSMAVRSPGSVRGDVNSPTYITKWTVPLRLRSVGAPTAQDLAVVQNTAVTLDALLAPLTVTVGEPANVFLHFVPRAQWSSIFGGTTVPGDAVGLTQAQYETSGDKGVIRRVEIVIDPTIPQVQRNHTIAHELIHAVGLGHLACASSIMDPVESSATTPLWTPSPLDQAMVALLYRPQVAPGMNAGDVRVALTPTATSGPACGPVQWELVKSDSGDFLFCQKAQEKYRPCVRYTGAEPTLPVTRPDTWTDGTSLYSVLPAG